MIARRTRWKAAGLAAALAGLATAARANTADSLTVTIQPQAAYSVLVTTTPAGYLNLGLVNLSASTQTIQPSTITVNSSYAYTGLTLTGNITSAGTPWTFAANTAALTQDKLAAWVVFTDTSVQTAPALGSFLGTTPGANSDVVQSGATAVGNTGGTCPTLGAGGKSYIWASGTAGYKPMECATTTATDPAGGLSFMWMKFVLPPTTTSVNPQLIQYTLTAAAPQ
jgi:hypothetical protein